MEPESITFLVRYHADEDRVLTTTVERWPKVIEVSEMLFVKSTPGYLNREGDTLTITVTNGQAVYREVACRGAEYGLIGTTTVYTLESSRLTEEPRRP
jgi:hypothetical protein